ncbi:methyltransferase family protein [Methylocapsa palsarum]|uniref:Protein-S-isoprenylcysteine O-methyltransferase Ste14 n=1 Tax=Methylocapsa palsarum TaxID=1612308 RepID=A0A1I3X1N8_9HYPH|nr:isoprenylcysteine carboxylmethyltransferase family protein [Methylocapsa palsarum]SFK13564.1 Protein-S-isoprenylcysteine O-methyltransferase Ste14 [Methylocapsa palsarum]
MQGDDSDRPQIAAFPPLIFAGALGLGGLLDVLIPIRFTPRAYSAPFGLFFIGCGLGFAGLALWEMFRSKTPVDPRRPTSSLVTTGVFKVSRNPIYLGMVLFCLGVSFLIHSLWFMALAAALAAVLQKGVILPEESYLERKFGNPYREYKANVRRWL